MKYELDNIFNPVAILKRLRRAKTYRFVDWLAKIICDLIKIQRR